jgi:GT2 family glycosyltransferase
MAYLAAQKEVTVVALKHNSGPGAARNAGMSHARNNIILFQDNDISLTETAVQVLYQSLRQDGALLLVMPRVVYRSDPGTIQFEGADCHILGLMALRNVNRECYHSNEEFIQTGSMVSACFMIDRRRWGNNGRLFDESFIFNLEDHDMGVRSSLMGYKIGVAPNAMVMHGGGTEGYSWRAGRTVSPIRMYCLIRNRWWIIIRYFSARTLLVMAPFFLLFELLQLGGLLVKGWGREWWRALADTARRRSVLYRERREYQGKRQRPDLAFLVDGPLPLTDAMRSDGLARTGIKIFESVMSLYWHLARKLM